MTDVIYKKGQSADLNETNVPVVEGQILITEDKGEMFFDGVNGRKKITDTNKMDKFGEIQENRINISSSIDEVFLNSDNVSIFANDNINIVTKSLEIGDKKSQTFERKIYSGTYNNGSGHQTNKTYTVDEVVQNSEQSIIVYEAGGGFEFTLDTIEQDIISISHGTSFLFEIEGQSSTNQQWIQPNSKCNLIFLNVTISGNDIKIKGVATPQAKNEATNKGYVDRIAQISEDIHKMQKTYYLSGASDNGYTYPQQMIEFDDTMGGVSATINANPSGLTVEGAYGMLLKSTPETNSNAQIAIGPSLKYYTDGLVDEQNNAIDGVFLQGNAIGLRNNNGEPIPIKGVASPTDYNDAVNKQYFDQFAQLKFADVSTEDNVLLTDELKVGKRAGAYYELISNGSSFGAAVEIDEIVEVESCYDLGSNEISLSFGGGGINCIYKDAEILNDVCAGSKIRIKGYGGVGDKVTITTLNKLSEDKVSYEGTCSAAGGYISGVLRVYQVENNENKWTIWHSQGMFYFTPAYDGDYFQGLPQNSLIQIDAPQGIDGLVTLNVVSYVDINPIEPVIVSGVATPVYSNDATNKAYVDNAIADIQISGGQGVIWGTF